MSLLTILTFDFINNFMTQWYVLWNATSKKYIFVRFAVPLELPILKREYFNRWYKLRPYYLAGKLADFLIQLISTFIYTVIVYYMSGQLPESRRFGLYMLVCFVVSLVGQTAGLIIGCSLKVQVCIHLFYYSNYIKFIYRVIEKYRTPPNIFS